HSQPWRNFLCWPRRTSTSLAGSPGTDEPGRTVRRTGRTWKGGQDFGATTRIAMAAGNSVRAPRLVRHESARTSDAGPSAPRGEHANPLQTWWDVITTPARNVDARAQRRARARLLTCTHGTPPVGGSRSAPSWLTDGQIFHRFRHGRVPV